MAKTLGIDVGDHSVKVVELDGSYRKARLLRVHTEVIADAEVRAEAVAAAAKAAIDSGMRGEVCLGHPCREAVLRSLELPFRGRDAIRKVVKAEVEGEIHSHTVDDMVVDFHEVGPGLEGGTRLLVASVPKAGLRAQIDALAARSIEPETVDLDALALWRAAHFAGVFADDEDVPAAAGASPPVRALVDVGARSVKIVLVEGENLVEIRALRLGDQAVVDDVARRCGLPPAQAREAVAACLSTGADQRVEVEDALPAAAQDGAPAAAPTLRQVTVEHDAVEAARAALLQRMSRELVRYLASSGKAARISAVWVTGGASRDPAVSAMARDVFGIEPQVLDVLARLQHDLSPEDADALSPRLATAVGLALAPLGGPAGFNLRQEDLALTRGFERLKFPLAIACMVGLLAFVVYGTRLSTDLRILEYQIGRTHIDPANPKARKQFHGMLFPLLANRWFEDPQHFRYEVSKGKDYRLKDLEEELAATPIHRRVALVRDKLKLVAEQKQRESGIYEDVSVESGLAVLVRFAQVMKSIEPQLGRYLLVRIDLNMKAPNRRLEYTVAFRDPNFRDRSTVLQRAFDAEIQKSDSPFERRSGLEQGVKDEIFKDSAESGVSGAYYRFTLEIKDSFPPFGPSGAASLGQAAPRGPRSQADGSGALLADLGAGEEVRR
jgi:Tfp pilus assembly PilM family ATPase